MKTADQGATPHYIIGDNQKETSTGFMAMSHIPASLDLGKRAHLALPALVAKDFKAQDGDPSFHAEEYQDNGDRCITSPAYSHSLGTQWTLRCGTLQSGFTHIDILAL